MFHGHRLQKVPPRAIPAAPAPIKAGVVGIYMRNDWHTFWQMFFQCFPFGIPASNGQHPIACVGKIGPDIFQHMTNMLRRLERNQEQIIRNRAKPPKRLYDPTRMRWVCIFLKSARASGNEHLVTVSVKVSTFGMKKA